MSLLHFIRSMLCSRESEGCPFTHLEPMTGREVGYTLRAAEEGAHVRVADTKYGAPSLEEVKAWLANDAIDEKEYHRECFDCDDFAMSLRVKMLAVGEAAGIPITFGYCEGLGASEYHAYNTFIDDKGDVYIVEPQNDGCVPVQESYYVTDFVQI